MSFTIDSEETFWPKVNLGHLGISHHPFPYIAPNTPILDQEVLKTHENINVNPISAEIFVPFRKSGSRNTMVTSDFRPEVDIW